MVLVDTSVWIRYFAGVEPYVSEASKLLRLGYYVGHDLVYGELLIGDAGGRTKFLAYYDIQERAQVVPHSEVVYLTRLRKLHGRGLNWIDVHLLASAMVGKHQLWTADAALAQVAEELGVSYRVRRG